MLRSGIGQIGMVAVLLTALACTGAPSVGPESHDGPGTIVLVTIDDFDAREWEPLGGSHAAPNLQGLVEQSIVVQDLWSANPMTRPALATLLTGVAPDRHGVRDNLFVPLPEEIVTLPERMREAGYRTAAFPDSNFLGFSSGLLRGFDNVAEPPGIRVEPGRWIPRTRKIRDVVDDFEAWFDTVGDEPVFAWVHFSQIRRVRLEAHERTFVKVERGQAAEPAPDEEGRQDRVATMVGRIDEALGRILAASEGRPGGPATVVVAGTSANSTPAGDLPGEGFSLAEETLRTAAVLRLGGGAAPTWDERTVWSPDLPATIAEQAGVELDAAAEGIDLLRSAAEERILFSWSWAPLDQGGWRPLAAARRGAERITRGLVTSAERLDGSGAEIDDAARGALDVSLDGRESRPRPGVPLDQVRPIFAERGLTFRPIPEEGRDFADPATRLQVVRHWLQTGFLVKSPRTRRAMTHFEALDGLDPEFFGLLADYGQILALNDRERGLPLMERAVELYPTDPEILHWYAHALWEEARPLSVQILEIILPFKATDGDVLYDLACARSLDGDLDGAAEFLGRAIEAGFDNVQHMERDPDLRALRESGRFAEVLREFVP